MQTPLLVKAGSGLATLATPPARASRPRLWPNILWSWNTTIWRSLAGVQRGMANRIAGPMIEPITQAIWNFVRASVPFIQRCRELCTQHGALLVFGMK